MSEDREFHSLIVEGKKEFAKSAVLVRTLVTSSAFLKLYRALLSTVLGNIEHKYWGDKPW